MSTTPILKFHVSTRLIKDSLNMPVTSEIVDCYHDKNKETIVFCCIDSRIKDERTSIDVEPILEKVTWDWNIDELR